MRNMNSNISAHNCSSLNPPKNNYGYNCRGNTSWPYQNQHLTPNTFYQADGLNNKDNEKGVCLGVSETTFKVRW